jgi:hypothetical protein
VRAGAAKEVPVRLACLADGIELAFLAMPEAVEYDEKNRLYPHDFVALTSATAMPHV